MEPFQQSNSDVSQTGSQLFLGKAAAPAVHAPKKGRTPKLSFVAPHVKSSITNNENTNKELDSSQNKAAKCIQDFIRETTIKQIRNQVKHQIEQSYLQLQFHREDIFSDSAQQIDDDVGNLCGLTPGILQWLLRTKGTQALASRSTHLLQGAVLCITIAKLSQFIEENELSFSRQGLVLGSYLDPIANDGSKPQVSHSSGDMLSQLWSKIINHINRFEGDIMKYYDETLQVIFPLEALFPQEKKINVTRLQCQRRALLCALELSKAFQTLEINEIVLAKDHMELQMGLAFGEFQLDILGSSTRREFLVSGETYFEALNLCEKSLPFEILAHKSIEDITSQLVLSSTFVRLRINDPNTHTKDLHESLLQSKDYINLCQHDDPYGFGNMAGQLNTVRMTPSFSSFIKLDNSSEIRYTSGLRSINPSSSFTGTRDNLLRDNSNATFFSRRPSNLLEELPLQVSIAPFVPSRLMVNLVLEKFVPQFERTYYSAATLVIPDIVLDKKKADLKRTQLCYSLVSSHVRAQLGELVNAWVDGRGYVILALFGELCTNPEAMCVAAMMNIIQSLGDLNISVGIGVASGLCRVGLVGYSYRFVYCCTGRNKDLSLNLASRAASPIRFKSWNKSIILVDKMTFLGLPKYNTQEFAMGLLFIHGFEENLEVFMPLIDASQAPSEENQQLFVELSFLGRVEVVKAASVDGLVHDHSKWQRLERTGMNISRLTLGIKNAKTVQAIIKVITIMSLVSPRIHIAILDSFFADTLMTAEELMDAVKDIQQRLQMVQSLGQGLYKANSVTDTFLPIYASLMPAFRMQTHARLADIYKSHLVISGLEGMSRRVLRIIIGSHYSRAGANRCFEGAVYMNQALSQCLREDPQKAIMLAKESCQITTLWQSLQMARGELMSAQAQFRVGRYYRKLDKEKKSFHSLVGCLRSFQELSPLLHPKCSNKTMCSYSNTDIEICDCHSLAQDFKGFLFIHHAQDQYSKFHFRCLKVRTTPTSFMVGPVECILNDSIEDEKPNSTINCEMQRISIEEAEKHYKLGIPPLGPSQSAFYRIRLMNRHSRDYILQSFYYLGEISLKTQAREMRRVPEKVRGGTSASVPRSSQDTNKDDQPKSKTCAIQ